MAVHFHEEDLPADLKFADGPIAVDTEAMGLIPGRDRMCVVQLSDGKGDEHLVRFKAGSDYSAPNLKALLGDSNRLKLYHFARFDIGIMSAYLGIMAAPVYCTRTASRLIRTYTDRHGLKELVKETVKRVTDFRETLASRGFTLHFQPIVDLRTREVQHQEALTRLPDGTSPFAMVTFAEIDRSRMTPCRRRSSGR